MAVGAMSNFEPGPKDLRIVVRPVGCDRFEARREGAQKVLCVSRSPLLDCAVALGAYALNDPSAMIYMRHEKDEYWALRGSVVGCSKIALEARTRRVVGRERWRQEADDD